MLIAKLKTLEQPAFGRVSKAEEKKSGTSSSGEVGEDVKLLAVAGKCEYGSRNFWNHFPFG